VRAFTGGVVCTGDAVLAGHAVLVEDGRIAGVVRDVPPGAEVLDVDGAFLAPGLVDLQVNGGGDVLLNDSPTPDGVARIVAAHRRLGSTTVMPTLVTSDDATIDAALAAVRDGLRAGLPGLLGLHLEGPFIDPGHPGVHDRAQIRAMTEADVRRLTSLGAPTIVTLAPEHVPPALIAALVAGGVHVAAGHSGAGPAELAAAVDAGASLVTHLYNAMSGLRAREPGLIGAALVEDRVACGLIADGYHVDAATLRLALRAKPRGRLFLVSDAMPPAGGRETRFMLAGEPIEVRDGRLVRSDGRLAGSTACLAECVANLAAGRRPAARPVDAAARAPRRARGHAAAALDGDHRDGGRVGGLDRPAVAGVGRVRVPARTGAGGRRPGGGRRPLLGAERVDGPPRARVTPLSARSATSGTRRSRS